jgi:hypothetical protein
VVGDAPVGHREARLGVEGPIGRRQAQRGIGKVPRPRHSKSGRREHLGHQRLGLAVALVADGAGELVLDLGAAFVDLAHQHQDGLHHVEGSNPAITTGLP